MEIIILIDGKVTRETNHYLKYELEKLGFKIKLIGISNYNYQDRLSHFGSLRLWWKYLFLAIRGIRNSQVKDIIISWNFIPGAIIGFLCIIFGCNRKIISLNMIAHSKGYLNSLFRKIIYNTAFRYKSFRFSVNDEQLIEYYSSLFSFKQESVFVLHDIYLDNYESCDYKEYSNYVFSGGEAYRDWDNFIKCAKELPDIQFIGVARYKNFLYEGALPQNLTMYFDIPVDEFYSLLKRSRIVFLPLSSTAPSGLIVLLRAGLLSKPVIITETPSTKNYVLHEISGILVKKHDLNQMGNAIMTLYFSEARRREYAENLKKHILDNFSPKKNAKIIKDIILSV